MVYPSLPRELVAAVREYVGLGVALARGTDRGGAPRADATRPGEQLRSTIAELTQFDGEDGLPAYSVPPLVPSVQGGILDGQEPESSTDTAPETAPESSTRVESAAKLVSPPKKKDTKLTKAEKRAARIAKIRARAYKPRLLDHDCIRRISNTADMWWDVNGVNDGTGISSIFSWAEWSSEHLRSGEMMLQHHCAKHFQTQVSALGSAATACSLSVSLLAEGRLHCLRSCT